MRRGPSHSSGMVEEIGAACRASMGLAFEASLDPKHAGGDHPRPPPANDAPRLVTSTQVKISFVPPQKRVLLLTSFQAHMHSLGVIIDPVLMSRAPPPDRPVSQIHSDIVPI